MVKKTKEYKPGDFVFAKVKGYPAWPARVRAVNGKKYMVLFYGTNETANLPGNVIFDYKENKDKFLSKSIKRREFIEGVEQIEKDISDGVELPPDDGTLPEPIASNDSTVDASGAGGDTVNNEDESIAETTPDGSADGLDTTNVSQQDDVPDSEDGALVIDESKRKGVKRRSSLVADGASKPKQSSKQPEKTAEPDLPAVTEDGQEQNTEDLESSNKTKKTPKSVQKGRRSTKNVDTSTPKLDDEELPQPEVKSRSGRKIKPKRFLDQDVEESSVAVSTKSRSDTSKASTPIPNSTDAPTSNQEVPSAHRNGNSYIANRRAVALSLDEEMAVAARHLETICPKRLATPEPAAPRPSERRAISTDPPTAVGEPARRLSKGGSSLFAKQVAAKLTKLDPITRTETEHKINCILFEAEMKMLLDGSSAPRVMLTRCS